MNWRTYPIRVLRVWRLGKWLIAKVVFYKNGRTTAILSRNAFGGVIPEWVDEYDGDISTISFRLISFPFEIVDTDRTVMLKFRKVSIDWGKKYVRLDDPIGGSHVGRDLCREKGVFRENEPRRAKRVSKANQRK